MEYYDRALSLEPTHFVWFQREVCLVLWRLLDSSLTAFSLDDKVDARLKDGWCKQQPQVAHLQVLKALELNTSSALSGEQNRFIQLNGESYHFEPFQKPETLPKCIEIEANISNLPQKRLLLSYAKALGDWVQLDTPGFIPNKRQHRMFGLAVLQMAGQMSKHVHLIRMEGVGVEIPNCMSSKNDLTLNKDLAKKKKQKKGRDSKGEKTKEIAEGLDSLLNCFQLILKLAIIFIPEQLSFLS